MSIISSNCRGLEQPVTATVHEFIVLVRAKGPIMVFRMETRRIASCAMNLKWRLGLKNSVGVYSLGHGSGIVMFWHESLEIVLLGLSPRFIDVRVRDVASNVWYRITFIYGEPRVESCNLMWETLRWLRGVSGLPWLVLGDFNETVGLRAFF
jgi:hypothetical protein